MMSLHKERKQKGAFLVLFAVLLPVFLLLVALVSEIGRIWAYHTKLQNAADAAALAGAANFVNGDTIDSHPNADLFADRYVTANLGHNLASSPNLQQFQAKTKAASGSEGEKSYYRVHLEEEIPLIQATAAWLHRPTFLVKATAVALIGKEGKDPTPTSNSPLFSLRSQLTDNFNSDNQNQIHSTYDGDVVVSDYNFYLQHINDNDIKYKFFTSDCLNKNYSEVGNDEKNYKRIQYQSQSDYDNDVKQKNTTLDNILKNNQYTNGWFDYFGDQNLNMPYQNRNFYDYYYIATRDQNMNINLNTIPFNDSSDNKERPLLVYLSPNYNRIQINLRGNSERPIIFYYPGKGQFEMAANGHNFNGMIYTPNAQTRLNFDGLSKFTGTVYADTLALPSNHGQYVLKDYFGDLSGSSGGGGSGSPAVKPRLVDNSLW